MLQSAKQIDDAPEGLQAELGVPRLLTLQEVSEVTSLSGPQLRRLWIAGQFPQPVKMGIAHNAAIRFIATEVQKFMEERLADREQVPPQVYSAFRAFITSQGEQACLQG